MSPRLRSLQAKLLGGTLLVIALVMVTVSVLVDLHQRHAIAEETQRRGQALARGLVATSQTPLLLYNFTALEQNAARVAGESDVVYAIVLDAEGRVAAHSRHAAAVGTISERKMDRRARESLVPLIQETRVDGGEPVLDFTEPILVQGRRWGTVRVGLSRRRMDAELRATRLELLAITGGALLLGGLAAALVARRISRPVEQLAASAMALSRGEPVPPIEPVTHDEIGRLATAFNHMAAQIVKAHGALGDTNLELRRRLDELADLKSYTDNVLASLPSGIVTVDLDGRVVTLNPAGELMTGFFAGEIAGRYCSEVFVGTPEIAETLMETIGTRIASPGVACTFRRRNGRSVPVEFSAAPLRGGDGKEHGVIGVLRDLTVVRELEQRLQRSDRLAALGGLAAGLAHEIRNPLTSLLTFSRHLSRRFDDPGFREKFQSVVPRELERINGIVERLLELARPTRLHFTPVRLGALLERVIELHADELEGKRVQVRREFARDLPQVWADQEALYQALLNLVRNALDAMPRGGRLVLRAGWSDAGDVLLTGRGGSGRRVRIEIDDTGEGIAPADSELVFSPFFSTKASGTGLGLALTHKIVEDHGGTIDFRSAPGVGTTFRILLPLIPESPVEGPGHGHGV
ncbi:MAG: ATP-binding protein [Candidatus Rokuibacteriota bacterium]